MLILKIIKMKKNLYLLYELIDREFESKLLLSILGAKKILDVSY